MRAEKLLELKKRMENVVASYISRIGEEYNGNENEMNILCPPADVYEDGERQVVFVETPGLIEDSVECVIKENVLVFKAEKERLKKKCRTYLHMERSIGSYFKTIPLCRDESKIKEIVHTYKYGVVKVTIYYED